MATTPSIKVTKTFTYRGTTRRFSNRYHFNGGTPVDSAHWTTFSDAVVAAEKAINIVGLGVQIVQTDGYAAGSDVPVFTKTYAVSGTLSIASITFLPGDVAGLIRYSTAARTTKNHPVYLFNYYHGVGVVAGASGDNLPAGLVTAYGTYGAAWVTGFSDGTNTLHRAGPNGASATGVLAEPLFTHRDLPRA